MENTKAKLRESIRSLRQNKKTHFNLSLLATSAVFQDATVIASYRSYGNEPDTKEINDLIIQSGKKLLLPSLKPDKSLEFRAWDGNPDNLRLTGRVEEPLGESFVGSIDLMIIPALAVDKDGNRLGQGGGSYDRTLRNFTGISIALINDSELIDVIPSETHDVPISAVLTPTRLIWL